jgi:hypothetical protein
MSIAIFGSGISGLLAFWACEQSGFSVKDISMFSDKIDKPLALGFQYLHSSCGIGLKSYTLLEEMLHKEYPMDVSSILYSLKVYGKEDVPNSITKIAGHYNKVSQIYNMNEAIDLLWKRYSGQIIIDKVDSMGELVEKSKKFKIAFSSIPLNCLLAPDYFEYSKTFVSTFDTNEIKNKVYYDVSLNSPIIRQGSLFGKYFIESVEAPKIGNAILMKKVASCTLDLHIPNNLYLIGRYGAWDKSILAHNVYEDVRRVLSE